MPDKGEIRIEYGGQLLQLLPDRAIYWKARKTLIVADVHLGKGAAFRAGGIPVPAGSTGKNLVRLAELIESTGAQRLVILGDFIHARASHQDEVLDAITDWRRAFENTEMLLVRGNHDRSAGRLLDKWDIEEVEAPNDELGLVFCHQPCLSEVGSVLCGHIHPMFGVADFDGSSVNFPCFVFDDRCAILPAFGAFTGGHRIASQPGRRIFITSGKRVSEIVVDR